MIICRFAPDRVGVVLGDAVVDVTDCLSGLPAHRYPLPRFDPMIAALEELLPLMAVAAETGEHVPLSSVTLLTPVANPGKIVGAPVNYQAHLEEAQNDAAINFGAAIPDIRKIGPFLKANSSLVGPAEGVALRHAGRRNDHEVELVAVIGKTADRVAAKDALRHVAGYAIGLDMTVRGTEERSLRKSVDSFCVVGPWMVVANALPDPGDLRLTLAVNGELRQDDRTSNLILSVAELIEFASSFYTLHPGDLLFTGTPVGVGPVDAGDVMTAWIETIGEMHVTVRNAAQPCG